MDTATKKQELLKKTEYGFEDLCLIIKLLRAPDGCPWDREQDHHSIRKDLIEEVYELIEGIDTDDSEIMREELGDVLLQVVFHAEISQSNGGFGMGEVCDEVCKKLIVRHPHVFGHVEADTSEKVLANWDAIKRKTKNQTTDTDSMRSVSNALPALMRAHKLGAKGRKVGFDFDDSAEAMEKVFEEAQEALEAYKSGDAAAIEEEFGDLLLAVVNAARLAGVDSEQALYKANQKFVNRFAVVEELCLKDGKSVFDTPREKKEEYWQISKKNNE